MEFQNTADLKGEEMPEPNKMLEAVQKDGKTLVAGEAYKDTWKWLHEKRLFLPVSPQLLERYAMSVARWIQCEEVITEYGKEKILHRKCYSKSICCNGTKLYDSNK